MSSEQKLVAEVAFPLPLYKTFHYLVPPRWKTAIERGSRILAPFGHRKHFLGIVLKTFPQPSSSLPLKEIIAPLDPPLSVPKGLLDLASWLSETYCSPMGESLRAVFPSFLKAPSSSPASPYSSPLNAGTFTKQLTPDQQKAVDYLLPKLKTHHFESAALYGVPASGKTEVYLRLIRVAIEQGGQVLFLLPEISLTQPFWEEISQALHLPVTVWHSSLPLSVKRQAWWELAQGHRSIVVGARSACLLPFQNLRLVIMDEEQDESYKEGGRSPFYHARNVILHRAQKHKALVILGSATPSLESYYETTQGKTSLISLENRVSLETPPPQIDILSTPFRSTLFHQELLNQIRSCLQKKEQIILLINRRGHSNYVLCQRCGWVPCCTSCGTALVLHERFQKKKQPKEQTALQLQCHHCVQKKSLPSHCVKCSGTLRLAGTGTQKVVQQLSALFPESKILRLDRDSFRHKQNQESPYQVFKDQKADILVGTKLVSKGFHFPEVTLVGVLQIDPLLFLPDFRAAEKTAQLLFQVAGRAGRAEKPGLVLIQTQHPQHPVLEALKQGEYHRFLKEELQFRKELGYPPYSLLIRLILTGRKDEVVEKETLNLAEKLKKNFPSPYLELIGPAPAVYAKLRGKHRHHLLIKLPEEKILSSFFDFLKDLRFSPSTRLKIDVDPYDLF
ncbi:MAG: primosomal protein N' [Elusimicrobia bacterium]|nr:primosomal protein N' [Elusimicrobiota bacterium]